MSSFETYDFDSSTQWQTIERSLEIPPHMDRNAVILKRKKKFYKQYVDPSYVIEEPPRASTSSSSSSSSQPEPESTPPPRQESYQAPPGSENYYNGPLRSTTTGTTHSSWSSSIGILFTYTQLVFNLLVLKFIIAYLLSSIIAPLMGYDTESVQQMFFTWTLRCNAITCIVHLLRTQGLPRRDKEYGRILLLDETTHFLFLSLILMTSAPFILGLIPIGLRALLFVCQSFKIIIPKYVPALWGPLSSPITRVTSRASEWAHINATLEVTIGFSLILQLITPHRSFMLLFIYWQYLRMRYMLSYDTQRAFGDVRVKLDEWSMHPKCPAIVRRGWQSLYAGLCTLVDPQQQQAQTPKCVIM